MKILILYILKALGLFYISRRFIAKKKLILAYHGFEIDDETQFRPQLFIKRNTLKRRLDYLKKYCNIIALSEINDHSALKNKVVITIDDGWYSTLSVASPIFKYYKIPYTVYLTTQNVLDNQPIFHVALSYILFKNIGKRLDFSHSSGLKLNETITADNITQLVALLCPIKRANSDNVLLKDIAQILAFDFEPAIKSKAFTLVSAEQAKKLITDGVDIQLHTHTHQTPLSDFELFAQEININKEHITNITGVEPTHHCYPSGVYNANSINYLRRLGIQTATTCFAGFCDEHTEPLAMPRFLDSERIPQIVFEAEVSGVSELLRNTFKRKAKQW